MRDIAHRIRFDIDSCIKRIRESEKQIAVEEAKIKWANQERDRLAELLREHTAE